MKRGFTLIELLIGLAIASIIITFLFNSFFQTNQIVDRADNLISINTRATVVHHQLEKDIMGAFIPVQAQQLQTQKTTPTAAATPPKQTTKKELKKIFYGINKDEKLDTLTFITNNPMSAYWSKQTGKAKPKVARVVYRLVEDKKQKDSYVLLRQEGTVLDFEAYALGGEKEIRAYELVDGIKKISVSYRVVRDPGKNKKEIMFETFSQWDMEKELPKNIKRRIPNVVDVTISLWDNKQERDTTFDLSIPIIPNFSEQTVTST